MEYPSHEEIRSLCTHQSYERGINYHNQGRIQELALDDAELTATVRGTHDYEVTITVDDEGVQTYFCSCPYDYAGACKHVVAVLLAANEQESEHATSDDSYPTARSTNPAAATDVQTLIEETPAEDLRTFLLSLIKDDHDIRDRFVAFAGEDTENTLYDYKEEIDRLFEDGMSRRGMIEYNTHIDFTHYHELAETHRTRGHTHEATTIYRALAESIRENMNRVDDSGGYYGRELEGVVDAYAETINEQNLDHDEKRPYIDYLVAQFIDADYAFVREDYDDALRTVCSTTSDLEHWFDRLDPHVPDVSVDLTGSDGPSTTTTDTHQPRTEAETDTSDHAQPPREPPDGTLYASDFTAGPLTIEEFTGETLDVAHLTVGPLELQYFVGDAFENFYVDAPTTVEDHTTDVTPSDSETSTSGPTSSLRTRSVLSSYLYLADELGDEETVLSVYDDVYLDNSQFCKQYAEQLIDRGNEERALRVIENGLATFGSTTTLQWLAADLYRERNPDAYRETLERLFLDHTEWDAYDELKAACDTESWDSTYDEIVTSLADSDRRRLIDVYIHEGELEDAFVAVVDSENLAWLQRYAQSVAEVDPDAYFEAYRDLLVPFAAGDTGRRHYREIADHLEELQAFVSADRFEEFVDTLKDNHSNRPAFLDELEKAGC